MTEHRAAAYMRVSVTDNRAIESESILNQQLIINRFLENNPDISLFSEFVDNGHSGLVFDRPSLQKMMTEISVGNVNCVIVKDLSRFGRDYIQTGRYLRELFPNIGVRFIAITDLIDTKHMRPHDDLIMKIKTIMNDEFSHEISTRTKSAIKNMQKNGLYVGARPIYGYKRSETDRHTLAIEPKEAEVVKLIFEIKLEGYTTRYIAKFLTNEEVPSPSGGAWTFSTVFRILKDETYTGTLIQGKHYNLNYKIDKRFIRDEKDWTKVENTHKAIVLRFDFETVKRVSKLDTRASPNSNKVDLLAGLLFCGCCSSSMTIKTVSGSDKKYKYYFCPKNKKSGCQASKYYQVDKLKADVFRQIDSYIEEVKKLQLYLRTLSDDEIADYFSKDLKTELSTKQQELNKVFKYRASINDALIDGVISGEEFTMLKEGYDKEIEGIEFDIKELALKMNNLPIRGNFEKLRDYYSYIGSEAFNRRQIMTMIRKIIINEEEKLQIYYNLYNK